MKQFHELEIIKSVRQITEDQALLPSGGKISFENSSKGNEDICQVSLQGSTSMERESHLRR